LAGQQVGVAGAGVGTPFTSISSRADAIGSWTRCILQATSNTATTIRAVAFLDSGSGTAAISNSYSGNGTSGSTIFGAQLVQLAGPTSYIPTTASTAQNAGDRIQVIPLPQGVFGKLFNLNGQTIYWQGSLWGTNVPTNNGFLAEIDDGTANNRLVIFQSATGAQTRSAVAAASTSLTTTTFPTVKSRHKMALSAAGVSNGMNFAIDGTAATPSSPASIPTSAIDRIHLGTSDVLSTANGCACYTERITIWPTQALSASQLVNITQWDVLHSW